MYVKSHCGTFCPIDTILYQLLFHTGISGSGTSPARLHRDAAALLADNYIYAFLLSFLLVLTFLTA